jgi:hypothetical protein
MTLLCAGSPVAAEDTAGEVAVASQQGEDDYVATCENGDRYRVYVTSEGRVVVAKID